MRHFTGSKLLLVLVYNCLSNSIILKPTEEQIAILQKTVKELLDLEQLPGKCVQFNFYYYHDRLVDTQLNIFKKLEKINEQHFDLLSD